MVRIGVIGAGNHASVHHGSSLRCLAREQPGLVDLAAVCDLDLEKAQLFASTFGFERCYTDYEKMIRTERLDALIAVTPMKLTYPIANDLLPKSIPLLIEKPPGTSSDQTRELLATAVKHRSPHMVSFNRRFNPALRRATGWIRENAPPAMMVSSRMIRKGRLEPDFIVGTGVHLVDATLSLLGRPTHVHSTRWTATSGAQCASGSIAFAGRTVALLAFLPDSGVDEETYEICGPGYAAMVETERSAVTVRADGHQVLSWAHDDEERYFEQFGALDETRAFVDAVAGGRPFSPTLADGLYAMLVAEAFDRGGDTEIPESPR